VNAAHPGRRDQNRIVMGYTDNVIDIRRPVEFTIDGRAYASLVRRRSAADLLLLAGLDPARCELGELRAGRIKPRRYAGREVVAIHKGARFVSICDHADAG
jgi:hypothetical protein